jgi:hypothetical protein
MIQSFTSSKRITREFLLEFITSHESYDFYFSANGTRYYITDYLDLHRILKRSSYIFVDTQKGDYQGIIVLWKDNNRYYVKIKAKNSKIAKGLLTVLLWAVNRDLYADLRRDNRFLWIFKQKGFRFIHEQGVQVTLFRKKLEVKPDKHLITKE